MKAAVLRKVLVACFVLSFFMPSLSAQRRAFIKVEPGVPETLAMHRKAVLHDIRYALYFSLPAERSASIPGEETISFRWTKNPLPLQVDFKAADSALHTVSVNGKTIPVQFSNEHVIIPTRHLRAGQNTIRLFFTAGESSLNRNEEFLYTLLVPDRARTVFPCFDQPDLKARFHLTLQLPNHWTALANAPLADSSINGNRKTYRFRESDLFSTYLFSFVAGKFQPVRKTFGERTMQFLHRETDNSKIRLSTDTIFRWHHRSIQFLEDYTGIRFPFQKLDFAAVPDFQYGGMEHVGAIDYKAATLFLDSGATRDQENARSSVIAHETAHMWFGDLVTMQWFNDVWMKEVFANFIADKITQGTEGAASYDLKFLLSHFPRAYSIDRTPGANPIRQSLINLQEAGTLYGPIIYNKAPIMMRQLERLMGTEAFRKGLRQYLQNYSFGNATWPDLIKLLDEAAPADLQQWNKVWVATPGRPKLSYSLTTKNGGISRLELTQTGEQDSAYLLPQLFELALVYKNRVDEITVNMSGKTAVVSEAYGKAIPEYILFNSTGQGYGVFPIDSAMHDPVSLRNPVMRASAYINLYENMLNGAAISPDSLLRKALHFLQAEAEELTSNLLAGYISDIYWRFLRAGKRQAVAPRVEKALWQLLQDEIPTNKKKIVFRTYQNIAVSKGAIDNLYHIWQKQQPPAGVTLTEDDYTSLALALTLKEHTDTTILTVQHGRITNPDRKQRILFLRPALSADVAVRDQFFASLKNKDVRRKEAWVQDALSYLHHPLRAHRSINYLPKTLSMLEEIQQTGDIFFPAGWLTASLGGYQSIEAAAIVRKFLQDNPSYNPKLKAKILQAADGLFRAERLAQ
jgi:aminopeptidase N